MQEGCAGYVLIIAELAGYRCGWKQYTVGDRSTYIRMWVCVGYYWTVASGTVLTIIRILLTEVGAWAFIANERVPNHS